MEWVSRKVARGMFGALVVGSLGFGATQALAAPTQSVANRTCNLYQEQACRDFCARYSAQSRCTSFGSTYDCQCYVGPGGIT